MHSWGEDWPVRTPRGCLVDGWSELEDVCKFVQHYAKTCARLGGDVKEKYGTLRFYVQFHSQLHDLFYPGYAYIQWGDFMMALDCWYMHNAFCRAWISPLIRRWQRFIYQRTYELALRKWPHLREEILSAADYEELLEDL